MWNLHNIGKLRGSDMLAIERKNEILDKLRAEQRVLVSDLAEYYNVTEETIRRDLDKLEKEGYATKTYGGAILGNSTKTDLSYTIRNKTNVEAKRIIAAEGKKAKRVSVIMPYLYEGRQHRRAARESLDCAMALQELTAMGIDNIITFDAHDPRVQNAIPRSGFENVHPTYQMLKALLRKLPDLKIDRDHMMCISPDEGAANRNIYYATMLGLDMGLFYKRRDYSVVVNGRNPIVAHEYMGESVEGKDVLIADDILATGDSMLDLARELKRRKCGRIFMATTFAMFTNGIEVFNQAYKEGLFDYILATNLNYLRPELRQQPWFIEVDMSKYIALIIATLNHDRSISPLLNPMQRIQNLLARHRAAQIESDQK